MSGAGCKPDLMEKHDIIIVGGGQMGLALGYYLKRAKADFLILDAGEAAGGAWRHGWDSLRLFSPAGYSSLPGWLMPPPAHEGYPTRDDVIDYLERYEARFDLPIRRPLEVTAIERADHGLVVQTGAGCFAGRAVVSATGTWSHPYVPDIPGRDLFRGRQIHSAHYVGPDHLPGRACLSWAGATAAPRSWPKLPRARARWVTLREPLFLPDEVDGHVLFERAVARLKAARPDGPVGGIGDIVVVPPVKEARARGDLVSVRPFERMTGTGVVWPDQTQTQVDAVIWCTGFRPALDHLRGLGLVEEDGRVRVEDQRALGEPRLWLAGYGDWTGAGSATLMGAARTARDLAARLVRDLG
jgi:cation diffusion facilitator CzcD-associated flavoprotein CzcO